MARTRAVRFVVVALLLVWATAPRASAPLLTLNVPLGMVTGKVLVSAQTADENVAAVRWTVDDWSRVTPRPFELTVDIGPVPHERIIVAVALDKDRRPLFRREVVLNPGGRGLTLEFQSPVDGQRVAGPVAVEVVVKLPPDDEPESLDVDAGGAEVPLTRQAPGLFVGTLEATGSATALVAKLKTRRGREAERTVLVNARGLLAESDAHVVEQLVSVTRGGRPIEDLVRGDFTVREERGEAEVREVRLLRDAPLTIGFAIDTSISLQHTEELKQATARQFIAGCLTERDTAFLLSFGPEVVKVLDWTRSRETLQQGVLSLIDNTVAGTALFEAIQKSLYEFQGQQGARALLLITDGNDYDGDVSEERALRYAREAGVKIYALGLTSGIQNVIQYKKRDANGVLRVVDTKRETILQPTNVPVLERFAEATGGQTYLVKKASDLPSIYARIQKDIRTQYLVSYVSTAKRRNVFHPVDVKARRGTVRTAPGFFY